VDLPGAAWTAMALLRAGLNTAEDDATEMAWEVTVVSKKKSAGLLLFREVSGHLEVLLVHPGGPFWAKKDEGAWSIPKGEFEDTEEPLAAAKREFAEETGFYPDGVMIPLEPLRQPSGKVIYAWAVKDDWDPAALRSNTFSLEWPPKSGQYREFPEIDRAAWFSLGEAGRKITKGQAAFLVELPEKLGAPRRSATESGGGAGMGENKQGT
jgi:predicted NUDIX family NTP pyrophosphohydrolase